MPAKIKPNPVGRPKLPKGHAKGKLVAVRLTEIESKQMAVAVKLSGLGQSEWIRLRLGLGVSNG